MQRRANAEGRVEVAGAANGVTGNRFNLAELAGAFGDLGTLIPFVAAYVSLLKLDPAALLLGFGLAQIVAGAYYRTPFPVQPMKAIGAAATTQAAQTLTITQGAVLGASLATGLIWLLLGVTGLARKIATWVPRPVTTGIVLGLGMAFMLDGIKMMAAAWLIAGGLLAMTLLLLARPRVPAMLVLLLAGAAIALIREPGLATALASITWSPRLPAFALPTLSWQDLWVGAVFLALPQVPLTLGNALIAIVDENNRLFPDRPVSEKKVALSTGLLNLWASAVGGVPMCHGAGGMAGHVRFGAMTGGASIMIGVLLVAVALFFSDSVGVLFRIFPAPVLGVILFLAGAQLALGSCDLGPNKLHRFVILTTAAFSVWNVGLAFLFGLLAHHALERGLVRL